MMFYTWSSITDSIKKEEAPTPESLRAAAKVLEDKAKELEKPKISANQQAAIDYAREYCAVLIDLSLADCTYRIVDKSLYVGEISEKNSSFEFIGSKYVMKGGNYIKLIMMIDDDGWLATYVEYPKS